MTPIANVVSKHGQTTRVEVGLPEGLRGLAERRPAHAFICSTESGFAPLGAEQTFLSGALGSSWADVSSLANWNRFDNDEVSLILVPSRNPDSDFRGLILTASERCRSYARYAEPESGPVSRDFFYNVTYEAIAAARQRWSTTRLAISHLTGCVNKPRDAEAFACNLEALAHYCDDHEDANIEYLFYVGCCVRPENFRTLPRLAGMFGATHRPIQLISRMHEGYEVLDPHW